jgi:BirA family biotin operon repressor/biotin-[acetyl-CoA-carboxylase] ligase
MSEAAAGPAPDRSGAGGSAADAADTRSRLIRRLADGRFHSGEALARELGLSRAAVWKALRTTQRDLGLRVQAVRGRGYRLDRPLDLLDAGVILGALPREGAAAGADLRLLERTDSTNARLLAAAREGAACGTVCLAEQQTAGRGRRGRAWASPYGSNVYLSMLWRYALAPAELSGLSLAAGLAVLEVLREQGGDAVGLKWPNDLLWEGRKLAGLLVEMVGEAGGPTQVVVGVGVNTFVPEEAGAAIDQPWVDFARIPGASAVSRNRLAARLIERLAGALAAFPEAGLRPHLPLWHRYDPYVGSVVRLHQPGGVVEGVHAGISETGALLLQVDGRLQAFHAGEVSLRPAP